MKKLFALVFLLVMSCGVDSIEEIPTTPTTIVGYVSDVERGIDIKDFKVVLAIVLPPSGFDPESFQEIDSVRTDSNGNYSITFDFVRGKKYVLVQQYYGSPYYTEPLLPIEITEGAINVVDWDAWYPTILKIELSVLNNEFPALRLSNKISGKESFHFATADIFETNSDTIVYQNTRPNSNIELNFHYSTGNSNEDYHSFKENINTTLQDTISLNYTIDCTTF